MPINYGEGVKFWKPVGDHAHCILVKNRWYWVGKRPQDFEPIIMLARQSNTKLVRIQGTPQKFVKLHEQYGNNYASLINHLPTWTPSVGIGER